MPWMIPVVAAIGGALAGTAAATLVTGTIMSVVVGVAVGAVVGAAIGAVGAAFTGGDIGKGGKRDQLTAYENHSNQSVPPPSPPPPTPPIIISGFISSYISLATVACPFITSISSYG